MKFLMKFLESLKNKKGQIFENLTGMAIGLCSLAITFVVVFLIMSKTKSNTTVAADSNATAALKTTIDETAGIPSWLGLIVVAVIGSLLLGLISLFRNR